MSDQPTTDATEAPTEMGTFDAEGTYTPRQIVENDLGAEALDTAYSASMVEVEDGQIVEGTVVKVDRDEVLLDIGYKSEGVDIDDDLWTTCFTPRELRLTAAAAGLEVLDLFSVTPGDYARRTPELDRPEFLLVARRPGL